MEEGCCNNLCHSSGSDVDGGDQASANDFSPFIHRFATSQSKYVYDVNTRRIIRVSEPVWDILPDCGCLEPSRIVAKHAPAYDEAQILSAIEQIEIAQKERGLFLSQRPEAISPPSREHVQQQLEQERQQLLLNVTENCNLRCSYCVFGGTYEHFRKHSEAQMTWEVAHLAIDDFLAHAKLSESPVISFYGGEPLLNIELIRQAVAYVKQGHPDTNVGFGMTTNGMLLHGPTAQFLAENSFVITISLDGPRETHDRCRRDAGGKPVWDRLIANIRRFLEEHPVYKSNGRLRFSAVATAATDLEKIGEFWASCDICTDSMGMEISAQLDGDSSAARSGQNQDALSQSRGRVFGQLVQELESGEWSSRFRSKSRWVHNALSRAFVLFHKRKFLSPHLPNHMGLANTCIPGVRRTFVDVQGKYFTCERVITAPEQRIGDVWNGIDLERVMTLLKTWNQANSAQCRYCWCLSHCMAGCFASLTDGQVTEAAKARLCTAFRRSRRRMLQQYTAILEENPAAFDYTSEIEVM